MSKRLFTIVLTTGISALGAPAGAISFVDPGASVLSAALQTTSALPPVLDPNRAGSPVTVPGALQFDFTSAINGETYRLMIATPFEYDEKRIYPVLYLLDGNMYFNTAVDTLTRQSLRVTAPVASPAVIVGIGYPTEKPDEVIARRVLDLTTATTQREIDAGRRAGGGAAFLRVLEEEIKPFVSAKYRVDRAQQILFAHSIAGNLALRVLFKSPTSFSTYVLSSPSIFFDNRKVLEDEAAFVTQAAAGRIRVRVLITSAADEQYRGPDPKLRAAADENRLVDNASELADRLSRLRSQIEVVRTIFPGEVHVTVSQAALSRAMRFALPLR